MNNFFVNIFANLELIKVALIHKILENFYISYTNIPNHYPEPDNLNIPPKTVNNFFKFSAQNSDLECLYRRRENFPVPSDLKPPLGTQFIFETKLHPNFVGPALCQLFVLNLFLSF